MQSVYLNQAGTTWPKPQCVQDACHEALATEVCDWSAQFGEHHQNLANFLGIRDSDNLLLTPGCTSALQVAIADLPWQTGDVVVTSALEHHALHRPLVKLTELGVELVVIPPTVSEPFDLERLEQVLKEKSPRLIAVTAACNVTGEILPIEQIGILARRYGSNTLIDGAQIVGWQDLNLDDSPFDLFAFGGHKGLHGPWGIGGLYMSPGIAMNAPQAVCDISRGPAACGGKPSYCDVGSVDRIALSGVNAAIRWLEQQPDRLESARKRARLIANTAKEVGLELVGCSAPEKRLPTIAISPRSAPVIDLDQHLKRHGVVGAAGLQCSPMAHEILGTSDAGVLRLSIGPMNSDTEIEIAANALQAFQER